MSHESKDIAQISLMFAKAYGIYFLVIGLALMSGPDRFRKWYEDILSESRRALFGGTISLLIGSFIIAMHHHIYMDWRIIITAIGYWGVFSGAGCLISDKFINLFKFMVNSGNIVYRASGLAWFILGLFLANEGFGIW